MKAGEKPKKRVRENPFWTAPEHSRLTLDMERYRFGNLILDPRPEIMRPKKPAIRLATSV